MKTLLLGLVLASLGTQGRTISVTVELPDGSPPAAASVEAFVDSAAMAALRSACAGDAGCMQHGLAHAGPGALWERPAPVASGNLGGPGTAELANVPDDPVHLWVKTGKWEWLGRVEMPGDLHLTVVLEPSQRHAEHVKGPGGPVVGARVQPFSPDWLPLDAGISNARGRAEFSAIRRAHTLVAHGGRVAFQSDTRVPAWLPSSQVCGTVVDAQGHQVAGALVHHSPAAAPLETSGDGTFCLPVAATGVDLWVSKGEQATRHVLYYSALSSPPIQPVLSPGRTVKGTLRDTLGTPVVGALVRVFPGDTQRFERAPLLVTRSDGNGAFVFPVLPDAPLVVDAVARDFHVAPVDAASSLQLVALPLHPLDIHVARFKRPARNVSVSIMSLPGTPVWSSTAETDDTGLARARIPDGSYALELGAAGGTRVNVPEQHAVEIPLRWRQVEVIALRGSHGTVASMTLQDGDGQALARSGENGRLLALMPTGARPLLVSSDQDVFPVALPPEVNTPPRIRLEFPPEQRVDVLVSLGGKPAPGSDVLVVRNGAYVLGGVTGKDGHVQVDTPLGRDVEALLAQQGVWSEAPVLGQGVHLDLVPLFSPVVARHEDGSAVADAWVPYRTPVHSPEGRFETLVEADNDAEEDSPPTVELEVPGHWVAVTGLHNGMPEVQATPCVEVKGRILDAQGGPVRARVRSMRPDGTSPSWHLADGAGLFAVPCMETGAWVLDAPGSGAQTTLELHAGGVAPLVELHMTGKRYVTVVARPGSVVKVFGGNVDVPLFEAVAQPVSAGDAAVTVKAGPLLPGEYALRVELPSAHVYRNVVLSASEDTRVELPLTPHAGLVSVFVPPGLRARSLLLNNADLPGTPLFHIALRDPAGVLEIRDLPVGVYWMTLQGDMEDGAPVHLKSGIPVGTSPSSWEIAAPARGGLELRQRR